MTLDGNWKPLALPEVEINVSAVVVTAQQIYLSSKQGVSAYDRDTGRRLFRTRIDCVNCQTWMVMGERKLVLFTQNSGAIAEPKTAWAFALDPTSGAVLKYLKLEATIESGWESRIPCYADGAVFVPTDSGVVKLEPTLSSQSVLPVDKGPPCLKGDFEAVSSKPLDETETPR
jgi:outer membrane protein assembly factor BamB